MILLLIVVLVLLIVVLVLLVPVGRLLAVVLCVGVWVFILLVAGGLALGVYQGIKQHKAEFKAVHAIRTGDRSDLIDDYMADRDKQKQPPRQQGRPRGEE